MNWFEDQVNIAIQRPEACKLSGAHRHCNIYQIQSRIDNVIQMRIQVFDLHQTRMCLLLLPLHSHFEHGLSCTKDLLLKARYR